jgi:hypothetical protein
MTISKHLLNTSATLRSLVERDNAEAAKQSTKHSDLKRIRAQRELQFSDADSSARDYLDGKPVQDFAALQVQENAVQREIALIEKAREVLAKQIKKAKDEAAKQYCQTWVEKERAILKRACNASVELHQANLEYMNLRQHLIDDEIGLFGIGALDIVPAFGHPRNRHSEFAQFCRDAHKLGFMKSIPAEYEYR